MTPTATTLPRIATGAGQQEQRAGNQADRKHQVAGVQTGGRLLLIQGEVAADATTASSSRITSAVKGSETSSRIQPTVRRLTRTASRSTCVDSTRRGARTDGGDGAQMHGGQAQQHHVQGAIESDVRKLSAQHGPFVEAEHLETGLTGVEQRRRDQEQVVAIEPAARDCAQERTDHTPCARIRQHSG